LKRNKYVALDGLGGTHNDKILHSKVDIIYHRKDQYGDREHIATNDEFGRDRSRYFNNENLAYDYFDRLTNESTIEQNLSQGVVKVIAGVEENVGVIPEYQLV
jgi:hypothetical protein